jgi:ubiquinone/menaquinone biosynthesis C-methylase UbiE/predicted transcriptional regulator
MGHNLDLDGLQRLLWNFAGQRVITVAGRSGILGLLAERQADPDEVAADLGLDAGATGKMIRALCAQGLVEAEGDRFRVVGALRPFFKPGPGDFSPFLDHLHSMYERWGENLEPWLRGEAWRTAPRTPEETKRFGAAMQAMGSQQARRVTSSLDLSGVRTMLDVGGGWGHFAKAMCAVQPNLQATVLDIPQVAETAPSAIVDTEFEGRLSWIGGNYLETDYGSAYDLVLLANILHQEVPPQAAEIIRRAAAALAPGGRVVVVDFAIDDAKQEHVLGSLFAINMRSFGDTYSEPELREWMEDAELVDVLRQDVGPDRWIISGQRR